MRIKRSGGPIVPGMPPVRSSWAGGRSSIRRPRGRHAGTEVPLPTVRAFTDADPLNRRVVDQMLVGVATRQYARSLDPLGADITTRGTSKSAVSRRFVAQTQAQLDAWRATPLDALELAVLLIDGVQVGGHCIVVALGIDKTGAKHPLGLWEGATENATVCQGLLTNLASRGLRTDRSLLVIVDGAKALDTAVTQTFGRAAVVQRCQVHKGRNILEHLPEAQRPWVKAILTRAYTNSTVKTAKRLLQDLARPLGHRLPECRRERTGRTRRHPDRARLGSVGAPPTIARHDERHRESAQPHAPCEAQRETLARWDDGAALGGRRGARSRQGVPSSERVQRYAGTRGRPPGPCRAARPRRIVRNGCVVVNRAAASISTAHGTSPPTPHRGCHSHYSMQCVDLRTAGGGRGATGGGGPRGMPQRKLTSGCCTKTVEASDGRISPRQCGGISKPRSKVNAWFTAVSGPCGPRVFTARLERFAGLCWTCCFCLATRSAYSTAYGTTVSGRRIDKSFLRGKRVPYTRPRTLVFVIAGAAIILSAQTSERRWLAGDSHVHSHWSPGYDRTGDTPRVIKGQDAIYSTPRNASMAERYGLSWMVTTDHGGPNHAKFNATQAHAELEQSRESVPGVLQFYGMELNMPGNGSPHADRATRR